MATAQFSGQYGHNMTLEVWSDWNRQDTVNNRSIVNLQARLRTNGYASVWGVTAPMTIHVDGDGEIVNASVNIGTNSSLLIFGKDYVVNHDENGNKTVNISFKVDVNTGGYGSSTVSLSIPLPQIKRASTISDVTGTLGSEMTLDISRKDSSYTHNLKYEFGKLSGTIATDVGTSCSWTPPLSLATAMPNRTSDWGQIVLETYSGSTKIGQTNCILTLNVPDSVKPTLDSITLTDSNATVKNLLNTANTFAQVMSNVKVTFNSASGAYGSTISNYRAEIVGKNQSTNSNNGLLGMMNFNGTVTIRATVTDSRGRTSNAVDVKVTVINYFTPQISFTLQRSGSASTTLTVTRNARIAPLTVGGKQKNKMIISFKYKEHSATNYTTDTGSAGGTWTTIDNLTNSSANLAATFSTLKTYDIIGKIEDAFTSYEFLATVGTEKFPLAIRPDRIGLGKTPEKVNIVDSAWEFYYNNKPIQHHHLSANDGSAILLPKNGTDLNTVTESGFYRGYNLVNAPIAAGWHYIRVSRHEGTSWIVQEAIDYMGNVSAFRVKSNNSWKAWKQYAIQNSVAQFTAVNQTKVYTATINGPYGANLSVARCGNIVNASMDAVITATLNVSGTASETIPLGYRPAINQHLRIIGSGGGGTSTALFTNSYVDVTYSPDGKISHRTKLTDAPLAFKGSISWITSDPFPS